MNYKTGTLLDVYQLESSLSNHGGTASVYLAHLQQDTKRRVAIKIAQTDPSGATHEDLLLQHEAQLLSQADWRHPGIVRLFPTPLDGRKPEYALRAVALQDRPWYMAMEYLKGKSLTENLTVIQKYPFEWRLELFYQILIAIDFIHSKGYAHRDLKPGNIVFRDAISSAIAPQPVLIDFALTLDKLGEKNIIDNAHTLEYAAPERVRRAMGDENAPVENVRASDVWSLGLIFSEILTGQNPLKNSKDVRTTIIRDQLIPNIPTHFRESVVLVNLISAMLNREPGSRPSVALVLQTLERVFLPPWMN